MFAKLSGPAGGWPEGTDRHRPTKGSGSRRACLAMVFKLAMAAERRWRRLNANPGGLAAGPQEIVATNREKEQKSSLYHQRTVAMSVDW